MKYQFKKPNRSVLRVFVHCSASDHPHHDNVRTMRQWHKQRGWSDVGYHYFIRKSGRLEIGRPISKTPAAQGGKSNLRKGRKTPAGNRRTIAICCHGLAKDKFTEAQFNTLRDLCNQINDAYDGKVTFHGHREVAYKECPVFDYKAVLGLDVNGRMTGNVAVSVEPDTKMGPDFPMKVGDSGWFVKTLQEELNKKGYHVGAVDGDFGKLTRNAVAKLKLENGMDTSDHTMPISLNQARMAKPHENVRENLTMKDLRQEGSTEVKTGDLGQVATAVTGVTGVGTAVVKGLPDESGSKSAMEKATELVTKGEEAQSLFERLQDVLAGVGDGAVSNFEAVVMIAAACGLAWWLFQRVKNRRLVAGREMRAM